MRSRNVVLDISISNHPGCSTRPERAKSRVPVEDPSPKAANASPPLMTIQGRAGDGLDVVDDRRFPVQADRGGKEGRLDPRKAALSLEALQKRRLLATDIGTRTGMDHDVQRVAAPEHVGAERSEERR